MSARAALLERAGGLLPLVLEEDFHARDGGEGARFDEGRADDPVADAKVRGGDVFEGGEVLAVDNLARGDDAVIGVGRVASAVGDAAEASAVGSGSEMLQRGATIRLRSLLRPRATRGVGAGGANAGAPLSALAKPHIVGACVSVKRETVRTVLPREGSGWTLVRSHRNSRAEKHVSLLSQSSRGDFRTRTRPRKKTRARRKISPQDIAARIVPTSYLEWTKAGGEARAWVRRVGVGRRPSRVPSKEPKRTPWS